MQIKAAIAKVATAKGEGGIDVQVTLKFIAEDQASLGHLFELIELQNQRVLVTMEGIQTKLDFPETRILEG